MKKRVQEKMKLPSSKRRRPVMKQERAIDRGAQETLEGVPYESGKFDCHHNHQF
ncbi:hypothetical protein DPMN_160798 [Dreissena polymorpha]|uniref:Uncharacterized protein n=1 Tax=Dreissena polymorpha TaxID=45954 RepID=A0A9D4EQX6_DREPO|nr:hypothetical protein DPMN_160798 [Dreissena polymorpha]